MDISGIEGRDPLDDFRKINSEIEKFNPKLAKKPQIVAANKIDLLEDQKYLIILCTHCKKKDTK